MVLLALISLMLAPPAKSGVHSITGEGATAVVQVPAGELVTVNEKPDWLFFSIEAGYEPEGDGPYTNVPAEMSIAIRKGSLAEVVAQQREISVTGQR
ncbi:MAG TPA: hypothetical protein PLD59_15830 [Tepidisphaeraceae bacterium]|nr:hypothetical protein [Tepidisphaeraceae bacterium]